MAQLTCPKCQQQTSRGGIPLWQIVVAILFFPIGLLRASRRAKANGVQFLWLYLASLSCVDGKLRRDESDHDRRPVSGLRIKGLSDALRFARRG